MHFNTFIFIFSASFLVGWCFTSNTLRSVNINVTNIILKIAIEEAEDIIILGNWYEKLYSPLSKIIWCKVSSLKNKALIV